MAQDDNYYPDTESDAEDKAEGGEKMEEQTTLIPRGMFSDIDPKPGDKCTFEIVHCYEDECEVKYVKREKGSNSSKSAHDEAFDAKMNSDEGGY